MSAPFAPDDLPGLDDILDLTIPYGLTDPLSGEVRFVGATSCGLKDRHMRHLYQFKKDPSRSPLYRQMTLWAQDGLYPGIVKLDFDSEQEAISALKPLGNLLNVQPGGEGRKPKTLLKLRDFESSSAAEIAQLKGCSVGTVRNALTAARLKGYLPAESTASPRRERPRKDRPPMPGRCKS